MGAPDLDRLVKFYLDRLEFIASLDSGPDFLDQYLMSGEPSNPWVLFGSSDPESMDVWEREYLGLDKQHMATSPDWKTVFDMFGGDLEKQGDNKNVTHWIKSLFDAFAPDPENPGDPRDISNVHLPFALEDHRAALTQARTLYALNDFSMEIIARETEDHPEDRFTLSCGDDGYNDFLSGMALLENRGSAGLSILFMGINIYSDYKPGEAPSTIYTEVLEEGARRIQGEYIERAIQEGALELDNPQDQARYNELMERLREPYSLHYEEYKAQRYSEATEPNRDIADVHHDDQNIKATPTAMISP